MPKRAVVTASLLSLLSASALAQPSTTSAARDDVSIEDTSTVDRHGFWHEQWLPLSNGVQMDSEDFYRKVGRPDLADAHAMRRDVAVVSLLGGLALTGVSIYFATRGTGAAPTPVSCDPTVPGFAQCAQQAQSTFQAEVDAQSQAAATNGRWAVASGLGAGLAIGLASWYFTHPEPISEAEANQLATQYDWRRVSVAPYTTGDGGGVLVAGRF